MFRTGPHSDYANMCLVCVSVCVLFDRPPSMSMMIDVLTRDNVVELKMAEREKLKGILAEVGVAFADANCCCF